MEEEGAVIAVAAVVVGLVLALVLLLVVAVEVEGVVGGKSTRVACDHPLWLAATVWPIAAASTTPQ